MKELKNLLPETANVLQKLATLQILSEFTFVGGSALAIHLAHRQSEDIDLFTWDKSINGLQIKSHMENAGFEKIQTVNLSLIQADFIVDNVKVTFFANSWDELKNRKQMFDNLFIAVLKTIAIMKVNALFLRATYRDYYDLYVLNLHHFSLPELFEMANLKIKNLNKNLFQRAIIFTSDIADENIKHLNPKYIVTLKQIETHFTKQIKNWNKT